MTWLPFALPWLVLGVGVGWWLHHRWCETHDEAEAWRLRGQWQVVNGGGVVRRVRGVYDWQEDGA